MVRYFKTCTVCMYVSSACCERDVQMIVKKARATGACVERNRAGCDAN